MALRAFGILAAAVLLLLGAYGWSHDFCKYCMRGMHCHHADGPRPASTTLKTLTSAQADFRANDRDGDGVNQFWRADIAGLYALAPSGGPAIRLIELSTALADARPHHDLSREGKRAPKAGYWYRALRHADEQTLDAALRFAAVAYPADYPKSGKYTFIVDENNTIYRCDLGHGRGIEVYPAEAELRATWAKLD